MKKKIAILGESELGRRYYPTTGMMRSAVIEARKGDIFKIARINRAVAGFAWYTLNGAFALYPYLHTIVIEKSTEIPASEVCSWKPMRNRIWK